ncbi:hypothetical protein Nepgr_032318 [Nepenthes gracilis]|uniref:WD repeat-containing protein 53 n=1 Tax=Nepenthes gracilis TaxID=150966 RepID=A0AAD3TJ23_NEPGR|nr:hypothetical protein Nepgr_032318 [Nepenthes gracilis]
MEATTPKTERRLRGHKATATHCISSHDRPGLVATAGEDGCVCFFDLRCKDVQLVMQLGDSPISSLCFKQGNENILYISSGTEVRCYDVLLATSGKPLQSYNYNKEEINQIACNSKSLFLAAADDCGDVKIIDIQQQCPYKTLRAGHTSICSSVQFLPWKPWEVITGGLDSKLVMWDFSRGRPLHVLDFGTLDGWGKRSVECCNPAFVHAIAVPEIDMLDKLNKICAVARGDGIVSVIDIESELAVIKSKSFLKPQKGSQLRSVGSVLATDIEARKLNGGKRLNLDYSLGGHTAAASCVAFSLFGEKGKLLISGGNDKTVKVWDLYQHLGDAPNSGAGDTTFSINLQKKVNWLCTTPTDSENIVVCDTSKVVKVYTIS